MNCSRFEDSISDYLDGLLGQRDSSLFAEHSLKCRACRALLDDVKAAIRECRGHAGLDSSPRLEASLEAIPAADRAKDCLSFEEMITEFLDGFVPAPAYHRFESHAAGCPECSSLLTEVVYGVAACHSVHTYEEYEVPESLSEKLLALMPEPRPSLRRRLADRAAALAAHLMPRATQGAPWSFATASALAFATVALLILDFSDDRTVHGIYRRAHVKAAEIYSEGAGIYAQKDEVVARIQRVGSGIGEIWEALGGEGVPEKKGNEEERPAQKADPGKPKGSARKQ